LRIGPEQRNLLACAMGGRKANAIAGPHWGASNHDRALARTGEATMGWRAQAAKFGLIFGLVGMMVSTDRAVAYTPEQQAACTDDAMRLCGNFVPDVDQITACMIRSKAQLSQRCAVYFQPPPRAAFANKSARQAKPRAAATASKEKSARAAQRTAK
jgi:hypothetical protein